MVSESSMQIILESSSANFLYWFIWQEFSISIAGELNWIIEMLKASE